jgi:hypothetical protein
MTGRALLICAATCPTLLVGAGLILMSGYTTGAGIVLCVAGAVDLLGFSIAIFGGGNQQKFQA